jgi:glutamate-1-semialdehyde 2,1-aminomutase
MNTMQTAAQVNPQPQPNLQPSQQDDLSTFIQAYNQKTAKSKQLAQQYRPVLADKTSLGLGFTPELKELCYPIVSDRASGAYLWDVDGNRYIDILMGLGLNLLGHNPPQVQQAIAEQLAKGSHIGSQTALAGEVAELVCQLTGFERVAFSNTGTEAVMTAVRMARAVTGRSRIAVFTNSYHGHFDPVLNRARRSEYARKAVRQRLASVIERRPTSLVSQLIKPLKAIVDYGMDTAATPAAIGIPAAAAKDVMILEYGNPRSLDILRRQRLAAVLVEPVQSRAPEIQPQEFLRSLRQITRASQTALIFDEMVTGFRVAPGGAQEHFGVQADLATYSKIAGGGLPLSIIAGRAPWMNCLDGGVWQYGDDSRPTTATTFFAGTFCKHPLALAAARAMLQHLQAEGSRLQSDLNQRTGALVEQLNQTSQQHDWPIHFVSFGSFFAISLSHSQIGDRALALLSYQLLSRGIYLRQGDRGGFLSTAHTEHDIQQIHQAFEASCLALVQLGVL